MNVHSLEMALSVVTYLPTKDPGSQETGLHDLSCLSCVIDVKINCTVGILYLQRRRQGLDEDSSHECGYLHPRITALALWGIFFSVQLKTS